MKVCKVNSIFKTQVIIIVLLNDFLLTKEEAASLKSIDFQKINLQIVV